MAGDASPRSRSRWSMNVNNVLHSPRARTKFRHFLEREYPRESDSIHLDTLDFWERCNTILASGTHSKEEIREVRRLAELVESGELVVNLDEAWLKRLHRVRNESAMHETIKSVLNSIATTDVDLHDAYRDFVKTLNKSPG